MGCSYHLRFLVSAIPRRSTGFVEELLELAHPIIGLIDPILGTSFECRIFVFYIRHLSGAQKELDFWFRIQDYLQY